MPGRVVVQWDKDDCADLGIVKVDLLGLGMMAVLEEAVPLIQRHEGVTIDYAQLPADDPKVYRMLRAADTVGVFQVESRAQMATLPRMKPDALLRPGRRGRDHPARADRRQDGQPVPGAPQRAARRCSYPHPSLEPILKRTLGVPLFQEQLLRMAMDGGRLHGRPGRGAAPRDGVQALAGAHERHREGLRAGMAQQRHLRATAQEEIVRGHQVVRALRVSRIARGVVRAARVRVGLPEGASPAAFTCALLNNWPMGFYHPATLVSDAVRHGVERAAHRCRRGRAGGATSRTAGARCGSACATSRGCARRRAGASRRRGRRRRSRRWPTSRRARRRTSASWRRWPRSARSRRWAGRGGRRCGRSTRIGRSGRAVRARRSTRRRRRGSPLPEMTAAEETEADFGGAASRPVRTRSSFVRAAPGARGVVPAAELPRVPDGRRVRIAGVGDRPPAPRHRQGLRVHHASRTRPASPTPSSRPSASPRTSARSSGTARWSSRACCRTWRASCRSARTGSTRWRATPAAFDISHDFH